MPLPPLLLERLKRRRIIQEASSETSSNNKNESNQEYESRKNELLNKDDIINDDDGQEEIIAEDHSDDDASNDSGGEEDERDIDDNETATYKNSDFELKHHVREKEKIIEQSGNDYNCDDHHEQRGESFDSSNDSSEKKIAIESDYDADKIGLTCDFTSGKSFIGCAYKYNTYHNCSQFCIEKFKQSLSRRPSLERRKQLAVLLKRFPIITNDWSIIYDPGLDTYYFLNVRSNLVSWLPPSIDGFVSLPAEQIRKSLNNQQQQKPTVISHAKFDDKVDE